MQGDPVKKRLCDTKDTVGDVVQVGLLEIGHSLVEEQRHGSGELVLNIAADLLVSALCIRCEQLQGSHVFCVIINVEMCGFVFIPLEIYVIDFVLSVIGEVIELAKSHLCHKHKK